MHSLITGGAGFIGSHLIDRLVATNDHITVVDDMSTGRPDNIHDAINNDVITLVNGSVCDQDLMNRLVQDCDRVFHLAAAVGVNLIVDRPVHTIETNIHGSEVVLAATAQHRRPILITSTSEVYGKGTRIPFSEDDDVVYGNTTKGRWSYAVSKAVDEFLALAYHREAGLPVVIVRLFNTVGPKQTGQYGMVVPRFIRAALAHQPLMVYGDGQQSRCFADVSDVVGAIVRLIEEPRAAGQVFNVGTTDLITIEDLAKRVIDLTGSSSTIKYVPYDEAYAPGFEDMRIRQPSLDRIYTLIKYKPSLTLDETLMRIVKWMRDSPQSPVLPTSPVD